MWTNAEFQVQLQKMRDVHTKIEVLNMKNQIVDYIEGLVVSGNINISNSNMVRRTLDITFVSKDDKLEISPTSPIWINKRLKIYIGIESYSGEIHYFNQGIYILNNPTTDISTNGRYIKLNGTDKMGLFSQPFITDAKFTVDTPINDAIKGLCDMIGETNLLIEKSDYKLPYDMQFNIGSDIQSALKDITNLYMDYQSYYNVDGYLVFEKIKNRLTDASIWDFVEAMDLSVSKSRVTNYDDVKNHVKVVGKLRDDGILPVYEMKIEGVDKPLSIDNIGLKLKVIEESKYTEVKQCETRCQYEIEKTQNMTNTFNVNCIPIYLINDVNKIINITDKNTVYKCLIDSISVPLGLGEMSLSAHEIF